MRRLLHIIIAAALVCGACDLYTSVWAAEISAAVAPQKSGKKGAKGTSGKRKKSGKPATPQPAAERSRQEVNAEKRETNREIKETRQEIRLNTAETQRQLNNLELVNGEIGDCNLRIAAINTRLDSLQRRTTRVQDSIGKLDSRLNVMTREYARQVRKTQGKRNQTSQMAFLLSSKSFAQAYRRLNAVKQFGKWRDKKQKEIVAVRERLQTRRRELSGLHAQTASGAKELGRERASLQRKQAVTNRLVDSLQGRRAELEQIMRDRERRGAALDAELNRIADREAAEVRAREEARKREAAAAAEAKRRREAEAAEAQRRQAAAEAEARAREEQERRREEAERAEAERQRAAAAAKAKAQDEAVRKARAQEAEARKRSAQEAAAAENRRKAEEAKAEEARKEQLAAEERAKRLKAAAEARKKGVKHVRRRNNTSSEGTSTTTESSAAPATETAPRLHTPVVAGESGNASAHTEAAPGANFADSKGRLPMPVVGRYTIVKRFGRQAHPTLPHVETNNAGIDMQTAPAAAVRAVYDGEVSAVFKPDGYNTVVVLRHGGYLTVYANLGAISVSSGQKVKAGQTIGKVYSDPNESGRSVLHFEIRKGRAKENPEEWLRRN